MLDRPRVDVTLRVSGFFRDAFPGLIDLVDSRGARRRRARRAGRRSTRLPRASPPTARALEAQGLAPEEAARRAGYRVFGSKPGAYGAGLQTLIDERIWQDEARSRRGLARLERLCLWRRRRGPAERGLLEARLAAADAVLHNQDNREHDLLDSDDYYQFEGGLALVVRHLSGRAPAV